jgi:hypothetical protein
MHSMAFSSGYRKCAAECAKLAYDAPSFKARESFSAAAKSWLILAILAEGSMVGEQYQIRDRAWGGSLGETVASDLTAAQMAWGSRRAGRGGNSRGFAIDEALARTRSRLSASQSLRCEHPVKKEEKND